MNASTRTDIERAAAEWLVRRDGDAWAPADAAALEAWLAADTTHRVAFLRLQAAWDESGRLQALGAGWKQAAPPPRGHWSQAAHGAGIASIDPTPAPTPPDLRELTLARRVHAPRSRAATALAVLSLAACTLFASWAWRSYTRVDTASFQAALGEVQAQPLADGSRAILSSDSRIDVHLSRRKRLVELRRGEAIFDVAKDPARPFVVDTGNRQVIAVGTRFSVRRDGADLRVVVTEGTVRLETQRAGQGPQPAAVLPAGSVALARDDGVLVRSVSLPEAEGMLDWRDGTLAFRDTTLAEAAAEFNRYNARKLVVADASAGALRVGGSFRWDNEEAFARLLERGFPVRAEYDASRIVLHSR